MWEKLKSTRVWLAIAGAVIMALQAVGVKVDAPVVNEVISAVCAVLVILGFMKSDSASDETLTNLGFDDLIVDDEEDSSNEEQSSSTDEDTE